MLNELFKTILLIVAGLFPIINPPAAGFIVLSMVPEATERERRELARRISINGFIILVASLFVGAYVLSFFGISMPVLRASGGIVISIAGWNLLQSSSDERHANESQCVTDAERTESLRVKAFYPLTLPITVGPGTIAVAIALGSGSPRKGLESVHLVGVGIALVILCLSLYICVRFAGEFKKLLGTVGTQVIIRLFAFVLFCIGVQIFWLGVSELLESLKIF
jgi:multiple antibiotic resistance protein